MPWKNGESGPSINAESIMKNLLWRIGGPQGGGIDRAALLFSRLSANKGLYVLTRREYHSNITGRHSYSDVRIGAYPVQSHSNSPHIMVCLDAESICRHITSIQPQGYLIYDKRVIEDSIQQQKYLENPLQQRLCQSLEQTDLPCKLSGLLQSAETNGVITLGIDYDSLFAAIRDELGISKKSAERARNIFAVAISTALLGIGKEHVIEEIKEIFNRKPDAIKLNSKAVTLAYAYTESITNEFVGFVGKTDSSAPSRIWVNGAQSVALGKLAAGLGIQAYYPISPATDESMFLEKNLSVPLDDGTEVSPLIFQTEDELSALAMASGAALTGARAATSTSGPGFSLMAEGFGWAGMTETPVVISLYQRGGPSTGMPTRTEQGDLQFAIHAGHGEFPRMVVASGDVEECFYDAFRAFNYAEQYQLPVVHMLDKNLASSTQTIPVLSGEGLSINRGDITVAESEQHVPRFQLSEHGISSRPILGKQKQLFWATGVEHSEVGQVSENPEIRQSMIDKRASKLAFAAEKIPAHEKLAVYGDQEADIVIVSWGSNKGAIVEAVTTFASRNQPVCAIMVKLLWPFPAKELRQFMGNDRKIVVVECNQTGQFCRLLEQELGIKVDHLLLKYTGRPFVIEELINTLNIIRDGTGEKIISHQNVFE